jgi:hypothetical protein
MGFRRASTCSGRDRPSAPPGSPRMTRARGARPPEADRCSSGTTTR